MAGFGEQKGGKGIKGERNKQRIGEVLHRSGTNHYIKGDLKHAEEDYRQAIIIGYTNHATYSNLGAICQGSGRTEEAMSLFKKAIDINPDYPIAHMNLGNIYKERGNLNQALASMLKSIELKPENPYALTNLGGIYKELGDLDQALASTLKAIELKPDNHNALMHLGGIYQDLGNLDQALCSTLKSLELKPDNPTAYMNLGIIYKDLGRLNKALSSTLKSLELKPNNPTALINLGGIYKLLGDLDQALSYTLKSLELKPDNPIAHLNLGSIYHDIGNLNQALSSTLKSLELKPNNPTALINLGGIYKDLENSDQDLDSTLKSLKIKPDNPNPYENLESVYDKQNYSKKSTESYAKAFAIEPTIENECLAKLTFPQILNNDDDIENIRTIYLENAKKIFGDGRRKKPREFVHMSSSLFMLSYQNSNNDREFLEALGEIVRPWLQVNIPQNHETKIKSADQRKKHVKDPNKLPRVGFYFDNTKKDHVAFRHYFNFVKDCHENNIEVIVIKGPIAVGSNSEELEKNCSSIIQLTNNLKDSVIALRRLDLDLLIYTEMHSSASPYCLAHNRIAPIQAALPGNLITTGIKTIDYFITSDQVETNDSHNLYTERLIKLKGMPHGITEIAKINHKKHRDFFDLPEKSQIFSLLFNLIKFHPDWDMMLEKIAQNNVDSIFILTGKGSQPSLLLRNRWERTAPTFLSKCKFYEWLSKDDYLNLLSCSDAALDPIHMGCGTTSIDALSLGVPIITKPGDHPRTRIAYGLYKIMGIKNAPIADSDSSYIKYCSKILTNNPKWIELKESINSNYSKVSNANRQSVNQLTEEIKMLITKKTSNKK